MYLIGRTIKQVKKTLNDYIWKKEEFFIFYNKALISYLLITYYLSQSQSKLVKLAMVLKVHLIKPKQKTNPSFYKTSQIKFQSLSSPDIKKFRTRSTQKVIKFNNPWSLMTKQQIDHLAQRLQDKPQQLYSVVKENQRLKQQNIRLAKLKFNKISFKSTQNLNLSQNFRKTNPFLQKNTQSPFSRCYSIPSFDPYSHDKVLNKISQKRKQYQKEMRNMIQDKRLFLQTDLPKLSKIKIIDEPQKMKLRIENGVKKNLPVWKMR